MMDVDKTHQPPHHHVAHHHQQQHSPAVAPNVGGGDEKFAVANDAAAAVAIAGGTGLEEAPSPVKLDATDPSILDGHHASPSAALNMSASGADGSQHDRPERLMSTPSAKERNSLTLDQRRALRRWANEQPTRPSHKTCIEWFLSRYSQNISQSTVSHSLSPKYQRLDAINGDGPQLSGSRLRFGNWPDIEKMVLMWYQQVQASGRNPTNEELGEKAKEIFTNMPRYRDEKPPEFSPGWIHRFKKRYGLLVRRHRQSGSVPAHGGQDFSQDIGYLANNIPRIMAISSETSPAAIRETVSRCLSIDASVHTCALVRDEILHRIASGVQPQDTTMPGHNLGVIDPNVSGSDPMYVDEAGSDDPGHDPDSADMALSNALRMMQQEDQAVDANAAAARDEQRDRQRANGTPGGAQNNHGMVAQPAAHGILSTPTGQRTTNMRFAEIPGADLSLTPIHSDGPISTHDKPLRCPFCINQRMLRTIKEAVEHMATHVVV